MIAFDRRRIARTAIASLFLALTVAGCGKVGAPVRPVGSDFPRQYPNPNPPPRPSETPDPAPQQ